MNLSDVCRICRDLGSPEEPLCHPCLCSGSMKFCHEQCLLSWTEKSGSTCCEVCGFRFIWEEVFPSSMQPRLPFHGVVAGLAALLFRRCVYPILRVAPLVAAIVFSLYLSVQYFLVSLRLVVFFTAAVVGTDSQPSYMSIWKEEIVVNMPIFIGFCGVQMSAFGVLRWQQHVLAVAATLACGLWQIAFTRPAMSLLAISLAGVAMQGYVWQAVLVFLGFWVPIERHRLGGLQSLLHAEVYGIRPVKKLRNCERRC